VALGTGAQSAAADRRGVLFLPHAPSSDTLLRHMPLYMPLYGTTQHHHCSACTDNAGTSSTAAF
jgi:hypothetical protein